MAQPAVTNFRSEILALLAQFGQANTIGVSRPLLKACGGDFPMALLLNQLLYWSDRTQDPDGWIAKSYSNWDEEIGLSEFQVRSAMKKLKAWGVESCVKKSRFHDGAPTTHYRLDKSLFSGLILEKLQDQSLRNLGIQPEETKGSNPEETSGSIYKEYTESTTETTSKEKSLAPTGAVSDTPSEALGLQGDAEQARSATQSAPMPTPAPSTETPTGSAPTTPKKPNVWRAVVDHVWGQSAGSAFGNILLTQLTGTAKAGSRKAWRLETPATLEEILGFGRWWKSAHPNTDVPSKAETLYERFAEFRGSKGYARMLELARAELPRFRGERVIVTPAEPVAPPSEALVPPEQLAHTYAELEKLMAGGL